MIDMLLFPFIFVAVTVRHTIKFFKAGPRTLGFLRD